MTFKMKSKIGLSTVLTAFTTLSHASPNLAGSGGGILVLFMFAGGIGALLFIWGLIQHLVSANKSDPTSHDVSNLKAAAVLYFISALPLASGGFILGILLAFGGVGEAVFLLPIALLVLPVIFAGFCISRRSEIKSALLLSEPLPNTQTAGA